MLEGSTIWALQAALPWTHCQNASVRRCKLPLVLVDQRLVLVDQRQVLMDQRQVLVYSRGRLPCPPPGTPRFGRGPMTHSPSIQAL